jgi:hypothetical protein
MVRPGLEEAIPSGPGHLRPTGIHSSRFEHDESVDTESL